MSAGALAAVSREAKQNGQRLDRVLDRLDDLEDE